MFIGCLKSMAIDNPIYLTVNKYNLYFEFNELR